MTSFQSNATPIASNRTRPSPAQAARRAEGWRRSLPRRANPPSFPSSRGGPWTVATQDLFDREPLVFSVGAYLRLRSRPPTLMTQCSEEALEMLESLGMAGNKAHAHQSESLYHALDDAAVAGDVALFRYARRALPDAYIAEQCNRNGLLLRMWNGHRSGGDVDAFAAVMVADLLAAGARWNIRNEHGETPLHLAAPAHPKALAALCKHLPRGALADAGLFRTGREGHTPLHRAARFNNGTSARVLLSHGADPFVAADDGQTPRKVAERFGASTFVTSLDRWLDEWQSRPRAQLPLLLAKTGMETTSGRQPLGEASRMPSGSTWCGTSDAAPGKQACVAALIPQAGSAVSSLARDA